LKAVEVASVASILPDRGLLTERAERAVRAAPDPREPVALGALTVR
jgi:hypothetical protein